MNANSQIPNTNDLKEFVEASNTINATSIKAVELAKSMIKKAKATQTDETTK